MVAQLCMTANTTRPLNLAMHTKRAVLCFLLGIAVPSRSQSGDCVFSPREYSMF